jgi:hypothetical protein
MRSYRTFPPVGPMSIRIAWPPCSSCWRARRGRIQPPSSTPSDRGTALDAEEWRLAVIERDVRVPRRAECGSCSTSAAGNGDSLSASSCASIAPPLLTALRADGATETAGALFDSGGSVWGLCALRAHLL